VEFREHREPNTHILSHIRIAKYDVLQLIIQSPMTAEIHLRFAGLDDDGGLEGEGRRL